MLFISRLATGLAILTLAVTVQSQEFPEVAKVCVTCHGRDGIGTTPLNPNLAGQSSIYLVQQLTAFRDGKRRSEVMNITAASLTDEEIFTIAEYYESRLTCR
jgi:cytochrome c553